MRDEPARLTLISPRKLLTLYLKTLNKGNTFLSSLVATFFFFVLEGDEEDRNGKAFTSRLFFLSLSVCFGFCLQLDCMCVFDCVFFLLRLVFISCVF